MKKDINKEEAKLKGALKNTDDVFNVPSGYFEFLPGKIIDQLNSLPELDQTTGENPFNVPDGYFENLPSSISERVIRKNKSQAWLRGFSEKRIAIPIAFATLMILAGLFYFNRKNDSTNESLVFTADDLKNSTYIESMDEALFVEVLSGQVDSVTDESFEEYLIDNNIDLSQIEKKL